MKVAVLFHRLGPYHHARLAALSKQVNVVALEYSKLDNTYAWDIVEKKAEYPVVSLFMDADVDTKPAKLVNKSIRAALKKLDIDVVAIPGWSSPASLAALSWCCDTNTPAILMTESSAHDEQRTLWKEWIKSKVVRMFSSALAGGKLQAEYAVQLGMPQERAFTGYAAIDNQYFSSRADAVRSTAEVHRLQYSLPQHYFLASNRFIEKKNLPRLLDAYASYMRQAGATAWDLVMLGDGPLMPAIRSQIERLGLAGRVHLPGFKQYDELPVFYGLADVFVQPSTSEQWGLVVNEAMASGLPVLVSNRCGCAPDLINEGVNGFTFDPYDVDGLAKLMRQISCRESNLANMGHASREIVSQKSPQVFATNLLHAAESALAAPRPRAGWLEHILLDLLMRR